MDELMDWIADHLGLLIVVACIGIIVLIVVADSHQSKERDIRYHQMLGMAKTSQDSLNVMLTFEKLKSDDATRSAIIGAGALAGSRR